jgi:hypothetical protein
MAQGDPWDATTEGKGEAGQTGGLLMRAALVVVTVTVILALLSSAIRFPV